MSSRLPPPPMAYIAPAQYQYPSYEYSRNDPTPVPFAARPQQHSPTSSARSNPADGHRAIPNHTHDPVVPSGAEKQPPSPPSPAPFSSERNDDRSTSRRQEVPIVRQPASDWDSDRSRISTRDIEKQLPYPYPLPTSRQPASIAPPPSATVVRYDDGDPEPDDLESNALRLLIYLSAPCFLLSLAIFLTTLISLLAALLLQPLRLCRPGSSSLSAQLTRLLTPALHLELRLIHSPHQHHTNDAHRAPLLLLLVHLLSPLVAGGVAFAAWVAACFWFFSAILGDPDPAGAGASSDGSAAATADDGRATILALRAWWERWLVRGLPR